MKRILFCLVALSVGVISLHAQEFLPIWEKGKMPNSKNLALPDSIANERVYQV